MKPEYDLFDKANMFVGLNPARDKQEYVSDGQVLDPEIAHDIAHVTSRYWASKVSYILDEMKHSATPELYRTHTFHLIWDVLGHTCIFFQEYLDNEYVLADNVTHTFFREVGIARVARQVCHMKVQGHTHSIPYLEGLLGKDIIDAIPPHDEEDTTNKYISERFETYVKPLLAEIDHDNVERRHIGIIKTLGDDPFKMYQNRVSQIFSGMINSLPRSDPGSMHSSLVAEDHPLHDAFIPLVDAYYENPERTLRDTHRAKDTYLAVDALVEQLEEPTRALLRAKDSLVRWDLERTLLHPEFENWLFMDA